LGDRRLVLEKMQRITKERQGKYPAQPSAGSFFKNIPLAMWQGDSAQLPPTFLKTEMVPAGWVNEKNGLKGYAVGGAMVSHEHGNFLINTGGATQADVLLVVASDTGVTLDRELDSALRVVATKELRRLGVPL
jgi:UDP-N-acetylmuramate dehydrogenase